MQGICAGGGYALAVTTVSGVDLGAFIRALGKGILQGIIAEGVQARTEYARTGAVKYFFSSPYLSLCLVHESRDSRLVLMADYRLKPKDWNNKTEVCDARSGIVVSVSNDRHPPPSQRPLTELISFLQVSPWSWTSIRQWRNCFCETCKHFDKCSDSCSIEPSKDSVLALKVLGA